MKFPRVVVAAFSSVLLLSLTSCAWRQPVRTEEGERARMQQRILTQRADRPVSL